MKCIKHENQKSTSNSEEDRNKYFSNLFNDSGKIDITLAHLSNSKQEKNYMVYRHICPNKVKEALEKMTNNKAIRPNNTPI